MRRCALERIVGRERDEGPDSLAAARQEVVGDGSRACEAGRLPATPTARARHQRDSVPAPRTADSPRASGACRSWSSSRRAAVCRSIDSKTQSLSTDVFLQLLDKSGVAMHGMPASSTLSNAFSSTFRQATPTMASMWPETMIFRTIGVPSRDEHLVAEFLGLGAEVADLAGPALLAVEAELVVVGRAALRVLQAVRQKHEPAVERNRRDLLAPELVGQHHHREAEVLLAEAERLQNAFRHLPGRFLRQRLRLVERLAERLDRGADAVSQGAVLRHFLEGSGVELRRLGGGALGVASGSISTAVVTVDSLGESVGDATISSTGRERIRGRAGSYQCARTRRAMQLKRALAFRASSCFPVIPRPSRRIPHSPGVLHP